MNDQENKEMDWEFNQHFIDRLNDLFDGVGIELRHLAEEIDRLEYEIEENINDIRSLRHDIESIESRIP